MLRLVVASANTTRSKLETVPPRADCGSDGCCLVIHRLVLTAVAGSESLNLPAAVAVPRTGRKAGGWNTSFRCTRSARRDYFEFLYCVAKRATRSVSDSKRKAVWFLDGHDRDMIGTDDPRRMKEWFTFDAWLGRCQDAMSLFSNPRSAPRSPSSACHMPQPEMASNGYRRGTRRHPAPRIWGAWSHIWPLETCKAGQRPSLQTVPWYEDVRLLTEPETLG